LKKFKLLDWLTAKEHFLNYFSEQELERALFQTGMDIHDLTEKKVFKSKVPKRKHPVIVSRVLKEEEYKKVYKNDQSYTEWVEVKNYECIVPSKFQNNKHDYILRNLIYNRIPELIMNFDWLFASVENDAHIIYLCTEAGSLPIYLKDLLSKNVEKIINTAAIWFNYSTEELLRYKDENVERECYEDYFDAINSKEVKALFKILKKKNKDSHKMSVTDQQTYH